MRAVFSGSLKYPKAVVSLAKSPRSPEPGATSRPSSVTTLVPGTRAKWAVCAVVPLLAIVAP